MWSWAASQTSSPTSYLLTHYGLAGLVIVVLSGTALALFRYYRQDSQAALQREQARADAAESRNVVLADQAMKSSTLLAEAATSLRGLADQMRVSDQLAKDGRSALDRALALLERLDR